MKPLSKIEKPQFYRDIFILWGLIRTYLNSTWLYPRPVWYQAGRNNSIYNSQVQLSSGGLFSDRCTVRLGRAAAMAERDDDRAKYGATGAASWFEMLHQFNKVLVVTKIFNPGSYNINPKQFSCQQFSQFSWQNMWSKWCDLGHGRLGCEAVVPTIDILSQCCCFSFNYQPVAQPYRNK